MLRKLSSKIKNKEKTPSPKKQAPEAKGAAVPYAEPTKDEEDGEVVDVPDGSNAGSMERNGRGSSISSFSSAGSAQLTEGHSLLTEAAAKGDFEAVRHLFKAGADINFKDDEGYTALQRGAMQGKSTVVRYLLLHGADNEATDKKGHNALYLAVQHGHTGTVGVLLDYMHSVDNRPRDPFVLYRAKKKNGKTIMDQVRLCSELKSPLKQGCELLQLLIAHGQKAEDMAVFLYSTLDVSVQHAFFLHIVGAMNMKNFQRFESKAKSQSLTVLTTNVRVMEAVGYDHLRSLILVSCSLTRLTLDGLANLELLDVRYNRLDRLPENIKHCKNLRTIKCSHNILRRLPGEIGAVTTLWAVDCSHNNMKRLTSHLVKCSELKYLQCNHNGLLELPMDIGRLTSLEELIVHNNKISQLPLSVSTLSKLKKISFQANPLQNIPADFPERAAEVREYLGSLQDDPVPNKTVKLVLVGQEGVGKTTLLKALKKTFWLIPRAPTVEKTEGVDVKDITLDDLILRCFDCGGDVDFNETHNFFITQGALYLTCFNLSEYTLSTVERSSFLLGRLQLWLQYIFSKVPNAQVLIVGTHADHSSLNRKVFEAIWEQLRSLLVAARDHHRQYFKGRDRLGDCLLCQTDSKCLRKSTGGSGFVNLGYDETTSLGEDSSIGGDESSSVIAFPHVVGYYEVSSKKSVGGSGMQVNVNPSINHLKDAIKELAKRMISMNPEMPKTWANVQESLRNHVELNPNNSVTVLDEVAQIAAAQGITKRSELLNLLHFLKAQGSVLYFPQLPGLNELVILDPEWLAKIFSSVVSFRDTGINNEGFIDRDALKQQWTQVEAEMRDKVLTLLRHFGLCLPVSGSTLEVFPCKLPIGEPDESIWPQSPPRPKSQLTYSVTFPSLIPPPLFSDLIVAVFRHRVTSQTMTDTSRYYSNIILDSLRLEKVGCRACGQATEKATPQDDPKNLLVHQVHFEMIPHRRTILLTVRGIFCCCMMKQAGIILNKVVQGYEGMGSIELDTVLCPGCYMQHNPEPHKFNANLLAANYKKGERIICNNAHVVPDAKALLCGQVSESCLPNATIRPKSARDKFDFSGCPKLFIPLPVNKDGMSFDQNLKLFVSSLVFDGYAAHLLCEFPDGYHITRAPGYRLRNAKEFMRSYGNHVVHVLQLLRHVAESSVSPQYAGHTKAITATVNELMKDLSAKFPGLKIDPNIKPETLIAQINDRGKKMKREDLRYHFHITDKPDSFGPLRRLKYGDNMLWLCNEHYRQMRVLTIGTIGIEAHVESKA